MGQGRAMEDWYGHRTLKISSGTEGEKPHRRPAALLQTRWGGLSQRGILVLGYGEVTCGFHRLREADKELLESWHLCVFLEGGWYLHLFTCSLALSATLCSFLWTSVFPTVSLPVPPSR